MSSRTREEPPGDGISTDIAEHLTREGKVYCAAVLWRLPRRESR
jgi:hypothetical protein